MIWKVICKVITVTVFRQLLVISVNGLKPVRISSLCFLYENILNNLGMADVFHRDFLY